jgi:phosphoribosylformylglycinamidine synthase
MRAVVVEFPGSNCEDDCVYALESLAFEVERWWHKDDFALEAGDLVVLPGGFSYGDYLRCGAMAALSPAMETIKDFAGAGGHILGICNGFQILCEAGLLPGVLLRNANGRFICKDVELVVVNVETPWTNAMEQKREVILPVAHGDGRYWADDATLDRLEANGQVVFRYAGTNPNGAARSIAGITNERGNVLGMMPHPERATTLRSGDGQLLWESIRRFSTET